MKKIVLHYIKIEELHFKQFKKKAVQATTRLADFVTLGHTCVY